MTTVPQRPKPRLLNQLRDWLNPMWPDASERLLQTLGTGPRHLIGRRLVTRAEQLRVYDLGVTIRGFSGLTFPVGPSWWEWLPSAVERLPPENEAMVPDRSGMLVVTEPCGQRGVMQFVDSKPNMLVQGRTCVFPGLVAMSFDLSDVPRPVASLVPPPTIGELRDQEHLPAEMTTAFDSETLAVDQAHLWRRFGFVRAPAYEGWPGHLLPSRWEDFDHRAVGIFQSSIDDIVIEAMSLICMRLILRQGGHVERWEKSSAPLPARRGKVERCYPVTGYELVDA